MLIFKTFFPFVRPLLFIFFWALFFPLQDGEAAEDFGERFRGKIALFEFENLTEESSAVDRIMPAVKRRLEAEELDLLDEKVLDGFLIRERVRTTAYVPSGLAGKIAAELNVKAILMGAVFSFHAGNNPNIGLTARLVDASDGRILWADYYSVSGEDFTGILGLGRISDINILISRAVDRLVVSFSSERPEKERDNGVRIGVMPFKSISSNRNAGIIAMYLFLRELYRSPVFEPVEYGDIMKAIVDFRIRQKGELNYRSIDGLSKQLKLDRLLVGTADRYSPGPPAEVEIVARLLNAEEKKVIWYNTKSLKGDENIIVFDWGKIRTVENVAGRVIADIVKNMEKTEWR